MKEGKKMKKELNFKKSLEALNEKLDIEIENNEEEQ